MGWGLEGRGEPRGGGEALNRTNAFVLRVVLRVESSRTAAALQQNVGVFSASVAAVAGSQR